MGAEFHSGSEKKQIYYISILKKKYLKTDTFPSTNFIQGKRYEFILIFFTSNIA